MFEAKRDSPFQAKLTPEQREEIVVRYFDGGITMRELADEYGVTRQYISQLVSRSDMIEKAERRADIRSRIALITLKNASADAAEQLVEVLEKTNGKNQVYAKLQALQQVLDRAGVREEKKEDKDVHISFVGGGIAPKMPKRPKRRDSE